MQFGKQLKEAFPSFYTCVLASAESDSGVSPVLMIAQDAQADGTVSQTGDKIAEVLSDHEWVDLSNITAVELDGGCTKPEKGRRL